MKKQYSVAEMEVINLEGEDVITTSLVPDCLRDEYVACNCHGTPGEER